MSEKTIAAIDLGTHKLKLCIGTIGEDNRPRVIYDNDFPSMGIKGGRVINPSRLAEALSSAIGKAQKCLGIQINEVIVNQQKCGIRALETSVSIDTDIDRGIEQAQLDELDELARQSVAESLGPEEEIVCLLPQGYNTDDEINVRGCDIPGMMSNRLEGCYKVLVGRKSFPKYIDNAFEKCGINLVRKSFTPVLQGVCTLSQVEMEEGVALVDFGGGATSVSVFCEGILRHYGAIPFGGCSISNDIKNVCSIPEDLAENIKLGFGGCLPDRLASLGEKVLRIKGNDQNGRTEISVKYLSEIITARTTEILESVLWEIQKSGCADKLRSGIVFTGGCAQTLNLGALTKQMSGYNARIAGPREIFVDSDFPSFYSCSQSTCAALIMDIAGQGSIEGCVIRTEQRSEEDKKIDEILMPGNRGNDGTSQPPATDGGNDVDGGDVDSTSWFGGLFAGGKKKDKVKKKREKTKEQKEAEEQKGEKGKGIIGKMQEGVNNFQDTLFNDSLDDDV